MVAIAIVLAGVTALVARHLFLTVRALRTAVSATQARLAPLAEELQAELAVTSTEIEHLQGSAAALADERRKRRGRR